MDKENSVKSKGQYDPGWNDPPLYSYDSMNAAGQPNPNKKVNILNKRVAYPMGQQKVISGGMNPTLPPSNSVVPLPPSSIPLPKEPGVKLPSEAKPENEAPVDKDQALRRVQDVFKDILEDNNTEIQEDSDEIKRRLSAMIKMWEDDRLNSSVHRRLLELVEALKANDLDRADHLHVGLAVDHPSVCASWIPGVRRIVQHLKSSKQSKAQSGQGVSEPLPPMISSVDCEGLSEN